MFQFHSKIALFFSALASRNGRKRTLMSCLAISSVFSGKCETYYILRIYIIGDKKIYQIVEIILLRPKYEIFHRLRYSKKINHSLDFVLSDFDAVKWVERGCCICHSEANHQRLNLIYSIFKKLHLLTINVHLTSRRVFRRDFRSKILHFLVFWRGFEPPNPPSDTPLLTLNHNEIIIIHANIYK